MTAITRVFRLELVAMLALVGCAASEPNDAMRWDDPLSKAGQPSDGGIVRDVMPPLTGMERAATGQPAPTQLATHPKLAASVAQRWIAFDSNREGYNRDLYAVHADGSGLTRLTTDAASEQHPAFSPDGTHLAYASDSSGTLQIYVRDLATNKVAQLTELSEGADNPSWSMDGSQLVFHSAASVFSMNADGTQQHQLAEGLDNFNAFDHPSLAPDGTVVFDRNNEIHALDPQSGEMRYVVQNWTVTEETPAVSPDGHNVAYSVTCGPDGSQIEVVPLAGAATEPCTGTLVTGLGIGDARSPAWGPNDMIAFELDTGDGTSIALTEGPGHEPSAIVQGPWQNLNPSWAPAGWEPPR